MNKPLLLALLFLFVAGKLWAQKPAPKPRVIVLTDAELDDQCSMVRFLLYADEFDIDGIITTSSQYHSHGHKWAGDHWIDPYVQAYGAVYPNLKKNDPGYPSPAYVKSHVFLGNVSAEGEMDTVSPGSRQIVKVLLDQSDNRPVWIEAWGGTNTLARALKTIQEKYPGKMAYVARKLRFFFIWEQDSTYQSYIRPNWGKYNILTIISDQFSAIAYQWNQILPPDKQRYFKSSWMRAHILEGHGPLCALYHAYGDKERKGFQKGDFRSEGDSPSFMYEILNGLRNGNLDHPDWGSWGGRYIRVRANTWLDPVPDSNYRYPEGRWYTNTGWGREYMRKVYPARQDLMVKYFRPIARWADAFQNDFAARADWCVKPYKQANHPPVVKLKNDLNIIARPGSKIQLNAAASFDPDKDQLQYRWWQYREAGTYKGALDIHHADKTKAYFRVPGDARDGETIHIICEVTDNGSPSLTRYRRVIITVGHAAHSEPSHQPA